MAGCRRGIARVSLLRGNHPQRRLDDRRTVAPSGRWKPLIFLAGFNVKMALRLGVEPIKPDELEECLLADAPKEADVIVSHARAKAELEFGNRLAGYPLLTKVFRGYESKAAETLRRIAADYKASLTGKEAMILIQTSAVRPVMRAAGKHRQTPQRRTHNDDLQQARR